MPGRSLRRHGRTWCAVIALALLVTSDGCSDGASRRSHSQNSPVRYSFFVAGHVYGKPSNRYKAGESYDGHLHPPFRERFDLIRADSLIKFGFFAGDIVKDASAENWDKVDQDIAALGLPVHFAVGNHDMSDRTLFERRYGQTYYSFRHDGDLFIVLDPNLDHWNITGEQLAFVRQTLAEAASAPNVFIITHQLLWWDRANRFADVRPNSEDNRADTTNFWSEVEPLFRRLKSRVFMFSGDIGAHPSWPACMYYQYANVTFIATGMGGGTDDNFVVADVHEDTTVTFRLVALNGDNPHALGDLETHTPPRSLRQWLRDCWSSDSMPSR